MLNALRPGEIVLLHVGSHPIDGSTLDADALPSIIREVEAPGLTLRRPRRLPLTVVDMLSASTIAAADLR